MKLQWVGKLSLNNNYFFKKFNTIRPEGKIGACHGFLTSKRTFEWESESYFQAIEIYKHGWSNKPLIVVYKDQNWSFGPEGPVYVHLKNFRLYCSNFFRFIIFIWFSFQWSRKKSKYLNPPAWVCLRRRPKSFFIKKVKRPFWERTLCRRSARQGKLANSARRSSGFWGFRLLWPI